MNDHEAVAAGEQAKQALAVLNPAMDQVRDAIMKALIETSPQQTEKVLALHGAIQSVEAARKIITQVVANGQLASAAIEIATTA